MRELTFCTSNPTKLAHARYIVEGRPVKIKGFRQRTYHADYDEPRLSSRAELLEASYQNALRQCAKAGIAIDSHPFLLEDTSVRIDALSENGQEIPGLDIKYWMRKQTFAELDGTLKASGNVRSVSVRSDVVLHVPKNLKSLWRVKDDYVTFVGEQAGTIVDVEIEFEADLVYPWLDNQSFNKWFQPCGVDRPFGALPINQADSVDFRRKSFEKMLSFLQERKYLTSDVSQLELDLERKPNLILSGYTCAGKTTASQYLAQKFGYLHIEASDFMYLSYYYRHGYKGNISIADFAERALAQKPEIAAEKVAEHVGDNLASPIVVSGFRAPEEVSFLKEALKVRGKAFQAIFVTAHEEERFNRLRARMRPGDDITMDEFRRRDAQQERMGLERVHNMRSIAYLSNSGSVDQYLREIDRMVGNSPQEEFEVPVALENLSSVSEIKLEDAILIALLSAWSEQETRPFFSTTQIASMINRVFVNITPKHKDNVSRYFNQDFYAYYDISSVGRSATRKYRLSNTGHGMAIRALRLLS
jgi:inosine/xanthosine triphosphate pyrophosphatase family protein/dephospho-CoA kinase